MTSHLGAANCITWTQANGPDTYFASWTLQAKKNMAYVIRAYHVPDEDGDDTWGGDLVAYGRNPVGDPAFLTGWWGVFGPPTPDGRQHQEMYLVTTTDQAISLRLEGGVSDTGSYALAVESCPAMPLTLGATRSGVNVSAGCLARGLYGGIPKRVVFGSFPADTANGFGVTVVRTSGTALLNGFVTGPDLDVNCWGADCLWLFLGTPNDTLTGALQPLLGGNLTLILGADTAGTTLADLTVASLVGSATPLPTRGARNPNARPGTAK